MQLRYTLSAEDYVSNLLFFHSINERQTKRRRKDNIISVCFALLPILLAVFLESWTFALVFSVIAIVGLSTQPNRKRKAVYRHFSKHVEETLHNRFGKESVVTTDGKAIHITSPGEEARVDLDQVETIYEVPQHFFVKIFSGNALIIPKDRVDAPAVATELQAIATQYNRPYVVMSDWKW